MSMPDYYLLISPDDGTSPWQYRVMQRTGPRSGDTFCVAMFRTIELAHIFLDHMNPNGHAHVISGGLE